MNKDYFAGFYNTLTVFAPTSGIVWFYEVQKDVTSGGGAIGAAVILALANTAVGLKAILTNGKNYEITVTHEVVERAMEQLSADCPWIAIGYDAELDQMYHKERKKFVEFCKEWVEGKKE